MKKRTLKISAIALLTLLFMFSCSEKADDKFSGLETGNLKIMLTDAPAIYDEVLIDIKEIMLLVSSDSTADNDTSSDNYGWISLNSFDQAVYNLLDFTNGIDTILASEVVPAGTIKQIRLVLGNNNQIKKDGEYFSLKTPSAQQSGLKVKLNAPVEANDTLKLWIDFDAARSIVEINSEEYLLKPVIKTYTDADDTGKLKGYINPAMANVLILSVSDENDTISTFADSASGGFLLCGLEAGIYTLIVATSELYQNPVLTDVLVKENKTTMLDTIRLTMSN